MKMQDCPKCGAPNSVKRETCYQCGAAMRAAPAESSPANTTGAEPTKGTHTDCPGCGRLVEWGAAACPYCQAQFAWEGPPKVTFTPCPGCGRLVKRGVDTSCTCGAQFVWGEEAGAAVAKGAPALASAESRPTQDASAPLPTGEASALRVSEGCCGVFSGLCSFFILLPIALGILLLMAFVSLMRGCADAVTHSVNHTEQAR